MAEEIGCENGRNSNFQGLVTLTLTLDPAIRHTVVHHSSTSTYIPNVIEIEETLWTDGRTYGQSFFPPLILLGRLLEVDLKIPEWFVSITAKNSKRPNLTSLIHLPTKYRGRTSYGVYKGFIHRSWVSSDQNLVFCLVEQICPTEYCCWSDKLVRDFYDRHTDEWRNVVV